MTRAISGVAVSFSPARATEVETDLLVLPVFEGEDVVARVPGLDEGTAGAVGRALASGEVQGKPFEIFITPLLHGWRAARVALIGAGPAAALDTERLRRLATAAGSMARQRRIKHIAFTNRGDLDPAAVCGRCYCIDGR
jgi:hypothetical protein